ncbi:hypothetical protein KY285_005010 [Solanum tuberosum]|nr:hypothetical protein KY289_025031 [Solanum tuberosum]KAH0751862.1 hypothetical protein KY285_005010 [Solanum tuberosum]
MGISKECAVKKGEGGVGWGGSAVTVVGTGSSNIIDECSWTDIDVMSTLKPFASSYGISKTLTEKAALEFAEKNGIDLVIVIPTWIHGTFITPQIPGYVRSSMDMILGHQNFSMSYPPIIPFVHVDDVTNAHIFLFENPNAKGRYICSAVEITEEKLVEFLLTRYPEFQKQIATILVISDRPSYEIPLIFRGKHVILANLDGVWEQSLGETLTTTLVEIIAKNVKVDNHKCESWQPQLVIKFW